MNPIVILVALVFMWNGAEAQVSNAPPPPAVQNVTADSSGNLVLSKTDGSSGGVTLSGFFSTMTQINTAIQNGLAAYVAPVQSVNAKTGTVVLAASDVGAMTTAAVSSAISAASLSLAGGPFTVNSATSPQNPLPTCSPANAGKVAYVIDLGGGPNNLVCRNATATVNGNFGYGSSLGTPAVNATCSNLTITPLVSAPIQKLTCTSFTSSNTINVVNASGNPGYQFQLVAPSSLGTLLTSIGINVNGTSTGLTLLNGAKSAFTILADGTLLQTQ